MATPQPLSTSTAIGRLIESQSGKLRSSALAAIIPLVIGIGVAIWSFSTSDTDDPDRITQLGAAAISAISAVPANKLIAARRKRDALRVLELGFGQLSPGDAAGTEDLMTKLVERFDRIFDAELALE